MNNVEVYFRNMIKLIKIKIISLYSKYVLFNLHLRWECHIMVINLTLQLKWNFAILVIARLDIDHFQTHSGR